MESKEREGTLREKEKEEETCEEKGKNERKSRVNKYIFSRPRNWKRVEPST